MKTFIIIILSMFFFTDINAQKRGNGNIVSIEKALSNFSVIYNGLSSNITFEYSNQASAELIVDENLINSIQIEVINGVLVIDQKEWISASRQIEIKISAPSIKGFKNSAHGEYVINNIEGKEFSVDASVGKITLEGFTDYLDIQTNVGKIDASNLETRTAILTISSFGEIIVNATEIVEANISGTGKVIYVGEPSIINSENVDGKIISIEENSIPKAPVDYINVKLKNNSLRRVHLVFAGPENARFSYGFPIGRFHSRTKRFPVGTKIYLDNGEEEKRLLLEVKLEDSGNTLKLF